MGSISQLNIAGLWIFSTVVFWPVLLFLCLWGVGMFFGLFMSPHLLRDLIEISLVCALPVIAIILSYRACQNAGWKKRGWIIYGTWVLLALEICFLLMAALGGVSQAVVEGVASQNRFLQYLTHAFMMIIIGQVILVPWVFVSVFFLKKIGEKRIFPLSRE
ncbi:MAG: hypothetical protein WC695_09160 [Candidatus Omnitrophota bacterium]